MDNNEEKLDLEALKKEFVEIYSNIKRAGAEELMEWLESTDFFTAAASTKFHNAREGGLVDHSIVVYKELLRQCDAFGVEVVDEEVKEPLTKDNLRVSRETVAIVSLLHDLVKVEYYKIDYRNKKNEFGQWEKVPYYAVEEQFPYGYHGPKSVYEIMYFMRLEKQEAAAIANHMGNEHGDYACGKAYETYLLAFLLHVADEAATYVLCR